MSNTSISTNIENKLDNWWDTICNGIQSAARKSLSKKKVLNTLENKKRQTKKAKLTKVLTQLGRWIRIGRINIRLGFLNDNIQELNEEIEYINQHQKTYIELASKGWTKELIEDLKGWWKIFYARRSSEIETLKKREIEENIEKRCKMINGKQGKMLTSLLDRPSRKIQIDRLIENTNGYRKLIVEPQEVLDKTKKHFQNQLRLRNFRKESLNGE